MATSFKKPLALISALLLALFVAAPVLAVAPAPGAFERTWARTDKPVADDVIDRTWIWGPEANTPVLQEPYVESPGGMRDVQYFDKSRMEINHPDAVDDGLWYVTNGLLVVELMTGMMQVGDDTFVERSPAEINIVGDPGYEETPTYADYADLRDDPAHASGSVITATIDGDGNIGSDNDLGEWNVTASELAPLTGHRTASVFWEFMNSSGTVYEDGALVNDLLFENPYYATGYPITEAYWSQVMLAGSEQWVLTQAFERRVLTYAPNNNEGFQVEAGNVGLHYYEWRYETEATITVTTFENDGTTAEGSVLVEAYALGEGEDCDDVAFDTDEPAASGTTDATTGVFALSDLDPGSYCVGADFDGDGEANDDTAVVTVGVAGSVAVSLVNPEDGVSAELTVTVIGDDDMAIAGADVELYAGTCAALGAGATPVATGETNASGVVVLDVDGLADGDYCVVASDSGGIIGEVDVTLPDDIDAAIGGEVGVTVTTTDGANEVQTLTASGATSGTFTLTFDEETTDPIPFNASAAIIQSELEELSTIGEGNVEVTGGPIHTDDVIVTFIGELGYTNVEQLEADSTELDGVELAIATTTEAVAGVNEVQSLSPNNATGGDFTLSFDGDTTADIVFDASDVEIQTALNAIIDDGEVVVAGGSIDEDDLTVTFGGGLAATDVAQITVDNTGLEGETVGVGVDTETDGEEAINEVQTIDATGASSGTFTLTYGAQTTGSMPYNANAFQIQIMLEAILGDENVSVTGGPLHIADVTVEFIGELSGDDVELLEGNHSELADSEIVVTTTTQGSTPDVQVITVGSAVTGGTFTLTFEGATTTALDFDATAAEIEAALELLTTIGNVTVTGDLGAGASSTITFADPTPTSLLVVDDSLIT